MTEFSFSHVSKNFGFKPVLKDLSFEVMTGERAALIGRNGTVLMVSHDRYFIDKLATKIIVLENRKIYVFDGAYADYLRVTGRV